MEVRLFSFSKEERSKIKQANHALSTEIQGVTRFSKKRKKKKKNGTVEKLSKIWTAQLNADKPISSVYYNANKLTGITRESYVYYGS